MSRLGQNTLFMLLLFSSLFAQAKEFNLDSLQRVLQISTSDTQRINTEIYMLQHYRKIDKKWCKKTALRTLSSSRNIEYTKGIAKSLEALGLSYYWENPDSAIYAWSSAINEFEKLGDSATIANLNYNLGLTLYNKGEFTKALERFFAALDYYLKKDDKRDIAKCLNPIGFIFIIEDDYVKAEEFLSKSLAISLEIEDKPGQMRLYNNLGGLYQNTKEYEKALEFYNKSLVLTSELYKGNKCAYYEIIMNIGNTYIYLEKYDTAEVILQETTRILKSCEANSHLTALSMLAHAQVLNGKFDLALTTSLKAEEMLETIINEDQKKFLTQIISDAYEGLGNYEKSLSYYKKHTAIKDSLFNESKSKEIGKLEAQYEMEKKQEEEKRIAESTKAKAESEKERRDNLQFSGIFVFVLILFAFVFMSGKFSISEKVAEGLIFFTFLLFFEFCLVLVDPFVEEWSSGEPLYKLLFNAVLAGAIFPLHAFFENTLKKRILKTKQ